MSGIKVLMVHDYELARRGLRRMLEGYEDIEVVGEAGNAVEAIGQVGTVSPDVILMDAEMPYVSGLETIRILKEQGYSGAVIVLSIDSQQLDDALRLGVGGYLVQDAQADELVSAIRRVPEGGFVFGATLMKTAHGQEKALRYLVGREVATGSMSGNAASTWVRPEESEAEQPSVVIQEESSLTSVEQKLLELLARGASDKVIAARLPTTEDLVKTQLNALLRKLGLSNRHQAVDYARRTGLAQGYTRDADDLSDDGRTERHEAVEEKAVAGDLLGDLVKDTTEPTQGVTGPADSSPTPAPDMVVTDVELVLSSPMEPGMVLKLHQWLTGVANVDVGEITGSWTGDTLKRASVRRPLPLLQMLGELPDVVEVTEEPYASEGSGPSPGVLRSPGELLGIQESCWGLLIGGAP